MRRINVFFKNKHGQIKQLSIFADNLEAFKQSCPKFNVEYIADTYTMDALQIHNAKRAACGKIIGE